MKKLRVTVEGKAYEVLVEILDEGTQTAAPMPVAQTSVATVVAPVSAPTTAKGPAGAGDVISPLAGKLVSIDIKLGDVVTEGAQVATIEAMKMNTYIYAPKAGKVTAINITPGDGVEEGTVILKIG
ncbi:MAG: acetyl-CoA carboxylase biotin carboxyl carrier protein subunit [Verrucomicrobia bacterium]|nr:acetyl-CoA carboxylase biotin carboxyl carrier protein subunit [Verrucomicrobiota bacterium]